MDLIKDIPARLYPVGRLDYGSEGLLLMTNDGALAQKLTKAGSHVPKTYLVKISGKPAETDIACSPRRSHHRTRRRQTRQNLARLHPIG